MAAQSFPARLGLRLGILGSAASLAIVAPLANNDLSMAAHTDASRIGLYFDRTGAAEKIGVVVMGTESLAVTAAGIRLPVGAGAGSVLTSDASGNASWAAVPGAALTATRVGYGSGANTLTGDALFTYDGKTLSLTPAALSGVQATAILSLAQTWNTTGAPTAILLGITETASDAASLLMDLQVGAISQFKVSKAGAVTAVSDSYFNGVRVGRGAGSVASNTVVGAGALAANTIATSNTAIGVQALEAATTGSANTAIGWRSLITVTLGANNTGVGANTLHDTSASNGTAVGANALFANTSGTDNTAVGMSALVTNTTGGQNTALGMNALYLCLAGGDNTALGWHALTAATGSNSTAVGSGALVATTSGNGNTALGFNSGAANITGANNTLLGNAADVFSAALSNTTALGYQAVAPASNSIRLGNASVTEVSTYGALKLLGTTSGSASIKVAAIAGTPADITLPTTNGTTGYALVTDGAGVTSWASIPGSGTTLTATQIGFGDGSNLLSGSANLTFSGSLIQLNLSGAALTAPPAGTVMQLSAASGSITREIIDSFGTGVYSSFAGRSARGTSTTPTALQLGDEITHLSAWGYGATGYSAAARGLLSIFAAENWTDAAQGTRISFTTTTPGGIVTSEKMRLWGDGGLQLEGTFTASPGPGIISSRGGVMTDTVLAGSAALAGSVLDLAQTWNTTGAPIALKLNVTDTASNAASYFADFQVGGVSNLRFQKDGSFFWRTSGTVRHGIIMLPFTSDSWGASYNSTTTANVFAVSLRSNTGVTFELENAVPLSWGTLSGTSIPTLALFRDGADGCLAQRVTTAAQTFRVYNTWTDSSNYERATMGWSGNVLTIGTQAGGTGTVRDLTIAAGTVTITGIASAPAKTLLVKRTAAQTANLQEWQDNSGGTLASVNFEGAFNLLLANAVSTSTSLTAAVSYSGSVTSASQLVGANISANWNSSGVVTTGLLHGMIVSAVAGANGVTTAYGIKLSGGSYNGSTLPTSYSLHVTMMNQTYGGGGGTITTAYGVYVLPDLRLNSTTTTAYSLYLDSPTVAATITNEYGIYQASATAKNYLAGQLSVGVSPVTTAGAVNTANSYTGVTNFNGSVFTQTLAPASALGAGVTLRGMTCTTQTNSSAGDKFASSTTLIGRDNTTNYVSSLASTFGVTYGDKHTVYVQNSGAVTSSAQNMYGVSIDTQLIVSANGGVLTLPSMYGILLRPTTTVGTGASGTITTYYGVYIDQLSQGGAVNGVITNRYGIYQADALASNYFAGVVACNTYFRNTPQEVTTAAATTAITSGRVKAIGNTAGQTLTLPAGVAGTDIFIRNAASVSVTIAVTDGTIEGAATLTLNAGESAMCSRVGTDWTVFN